MSIILATLYQFTQVGPQAIDRIPALFSHTPYVMNSTIPQLKLNTTPGCLTFENLEWQIKALWWHANSPYLSRVNLCSLSKNCRSPFHHPACLFKLRTNSLWRMYTIAIVCVAVSECRVDVNVEAISNHRPQPHKISMSENVSENEWDQCKNEWDNMLSNQTCMHLRQ